MKCPDCGGSGVAPRHVGELDQNCETCCGNGNVACAGCIEKNKLLREAQQAILADEARKRIAELERKNEQLECDECGGKGIYFIDDEKMVCPCVGDTEAYGELQAKVKQLESALNVPPYLENEVLKRKVAELEGELRTVASQGGEE